MDEVDIQISITGTIARCFLTEMFDAALSVTPSGWSIELSINPTPETDRGMPDPDEAESTEQEQSE